MASASTFSQLEANYFSNKMPTKRVRMDCCFVMTTESESISGDAGRFVAGATGRSERSIFAPMELG